MLGCTFEHQLSVLSVVHADYHVISYLSVTFLFMIILLSFAVYRVVIYVHTVYMHEHIPIFLTHSLGRFLTTQNFARPDIGHFILCSGFVEIVRLTRS